MIASIVVMIKLVMMTMKLLGEGGEFRTVVVPLRPQGFGLQTHQEPFVIKREVDQRKAQDVSGLDCLSHPTKPPQHELHEGSDNDDDADDDDDDDDHENC